MPRADGTGPPRGGRPGMGRGIGRRGSGGGRMGGTRPGVGLGGDCVCPNCGTRTPHQVGTPCYNSICPKCGANMIRG